MKEFIINENEAGQRFDKYLGKLLREAPKSFFYKMLRKKNITLNGGRATGNEKLSTGDHVKLFLSDETFGKFAGVQETVARAHQKLDIVYEDDNILLINKPVGMLSQPADDKEPSLVEYLTGYLLKAERLRKRLYIPSAHLSAIVWTVIPADLWLQGSPWQDFRSFLHCFMIEAFTNFTVAW